MADWKPDLFAYLDYRAYLGDYYRAAKQHTRAFSYRYFSKKAGYASPNFLKLVIDGKRNLGPDSVPRFAKALGMSAEEKRFFGHLVAFDQAETPEERAEAYERVAGFARFRNARRIDASYIDYLSHWYYPAIREMSARPDFDEDPVWIATQLIPPITVDQAQRALDVLLDLGLLTRDEDGTLHRGDVAWTTGHEVRAFAAGNYHRQMMERAGASIELVERKRRHLNAQTLCVSLETALDIKQRVIELCERTAALADDDDRPEVVYQLNIQFFPLSRTTEE